MTLSARISKMARVEAQAQWLQRTFRLTHWEIVVEWNSGETNEGSATVDAQYQRAALRFNVHEVNTNTVAHEFAHVLLSRYAAAAERYVKEKGESSLSFAEEECVTSMECGLVWMLRQAGLR